MLKQSSKFQCGKCGKLMAVGADLVGKQVRCPNCQQVVVAPAPTSAAPVPIPSPPPRDPAPTVPVFHVHQRQEEESIFEAPEEMCDGLFDSEPAPRLELPPSSSSPTVAKFAPAPAPLLAPLSVPHPDEAPVAAHANAFVPPPNGVSETAPVAMLLDDNDSATVMSQRRVHERAEQESLRIYYLLIFLIPYSIFTTLGLLWYSLKPQTLSDPFEKLLDWPRDSMDPYEKQKKSGTYNRVKDDRPLAAHLRTSLGTTIRVGDLEVTPIKVERRKITYVQIKGWAKPTLSVNEALVLTSKVKNVANDYAFAPNDLAYNRYVDKTLAATQKPYTCLELLDDGVRFYGGPCKWPREIEKKGLRPPDPLEYIEGTEYDRMLKPGEETNIIVCTNPSNLDIGRSPTEVLRKVEQYKGRLLWRVQLRRGLVKVRGADVSATCVIGVEFDNNDIR